eukprot:scaffold2647_cov47-Phaeocystis_antarctica.AAC.3
MEEHVRLLGWRRLRERLRLRAKLGRQRTELKRRGARRMFSLQRAHRTCTRANTEHSTHVRTPI